MESVERKQMRDFTSFPCSTLDLAIQTAHSKNKLLLVLFRKGDLDFEQIFFDLYCNMEVNGFFKECYVPFELDELRTLQDYFYIQLRNSAILIFSATENDGLSLLQKIEGSISSADLLSDLQMISLEYSDESLDPVSEFTNTSQNFQDAVKQAEDSGKLLVIFVKDDPLDFKFIRDEQKNGFFTDSYIFFELDLSEITIVQIRCFVPIETSALLIFAAVNGQLILKEMFGEDVPLAKLSLTLKCLTQVQQENEIASASVFENDHHNLQEALISAREQRKLLAVIVHMHCEKFDQIINDLTTNEDLNGVFKDDLVMFRLDKKDMILLKKYYYISLKHSALLLFSVEAGYKLELKRIFQDIHVDPGYLLFELLEEQSKYQVELDKYFETDIEMCTNSAISALNLYSIANGLCTNISDAILDAQCEPSYKKKAFILFIGADDMDWTDRELWKNLQVEFAKYMGLFNLVVWDNRIGRYKESVNYTLNKYLANIKSGIDTEISRFYVIVYEGDDWILQTTVSPLSDYNDDFCMFFNNFAEKYDHTVLLENESIKSFSDIFRLNTSMTISQKTLSDTIQADCLGDSPKCLLLFCRVTGRIDHERFWRAVPKEFVIVNWDLNKNRGVLKKIVEREFDLEKLTFLVEKCPEDMVFAFVPIGDNLIFHSFLSESTEGTTKKWLVKVSNFFTAESQLDGNCSNNGGAIGFHQIMLQEMGDRDYDAFEIHKGQEKQLKEKILYSTYGPPSSTVSEGHTDGYANKNIKKIEPILQKVKETSLPFSENKNTAYVGFVWACVVPFPHEKAKRKIKNRNYVPHEDFTTYPLYIIRKCQYRNGGTRPCRLIVDHLGRVYETWNGFLENNKYPEGLLVVPQYGRYTSKWNGTVNIELMPTPASKIGPAILSAIDTTATVVGVLSAVACIGASVVAIPFMLPVGIFSGAAVGLYTVGRSVGNLIERSKHKQSIGLGDSESRAAYITIAAGGLGFASAGATMALAFYASNGRNVANIVKLSVNSLNVVNIAAGGTALANSATDVFLQWREDGNVNKLAILQLGTSLLFFAHSVQSFKSANDIVNRAQFEALESISQDLRSNRHRKTVNRIRNANLQKNNGNVQAANAEVIQFLRTVDNRDEVLAILTRNTKAMSERGIKYSTSNGKVTFNGEVINIQEFGAASKAARMEFLSKLPSTPVETMTTAGRNASSVPNSKAFLKLLPSVTDGIDFTLSVAKIACSSEPIVKKCKTILCEFTPYVQQLLIKLCNKTLPQILSDEIMKANFASLYPGSEMYLRNLQIIIRFFKGNSLLPVLKGVLPESIYSEIEANWKTLKGTVRFAEKVIIYSMMSIKNLIFLLIRNTVKTVGALIMDRLGANGNRTTENNANSSALKYCSVCKGEHY